MVSSPLEPPCWKVSVRDSPGIWGHRNVFYLSYVLESSGQTQAPHSPGSRVDTAPVPVILPSRKTGKSNQPGKSCLSSLSSGFKILHAPKHIWCVKLDICMCTAHSASRNTERPTPCLPPLTFPLPLHQSGPSVADAFCAWLLSFAVMHQ